jgi:hypothetical protein
MRIIYKDYLNNFNIGLDTGITFDAYRQGMFHLIKVKKSGICHTSFKNYDLAEGQYSWVLDRDIQLFGEMETE